MAHPQLSPQQQRNFDTSTSIPTSSSSTPLNVTTRNRSNYSSIIQSDDHQSNDGYDSIVVVDLESNH